MAAYRAQGRRGTARAAAGDGLANIGKRRLQSLLLAGSVAIGVALAITIIAASNGVEAKVTQLLDIDPRPPQIDFDEILAVLTDTRGVLTILAYGFTAVLVASVTWLSFGRRRREIGIKRARGFYVWQLLIELWVEATVLCLAGGIAGVGLGYLLCGAIHRSIATLPLDPATDDVLRVFPTVVLISFAATGAVAAYFSLRPMTHQDY